MFSWKRARAQRVSTLNGEFSESALDEALSEVTNDVVTAGEKVAQALPKRRAARECQRCNR